MHHSINNIILITYEKFLVTFNINNHKIYVLCRSKTKRFEIEIARCHLQLVHAGQRDFDARINGDVRVR